MVAQWRAGGAGGSTTQVCAVTSAQVSVAASVAVVAITSPACEQILGLSLRIRVGRQLLFVQLPCPAVVLLQGR